MQRLRRARRGTERERARTLLLVAALCVAACGNAARPTVPGAQLPLDWLVVGTHRISVEVASGPVERDRGLMFRESLPADHGMLFIFPEERLLTFWMRNTSVPLSIAYADAGGRIVRITDLEPHDERPVSSGRPARYALEMNRGWFRAHAVFEGDRITDIPKVVAK